MLAAWFPYSVVRRSPPPTGSYVAAINHFSFMDPPIAGLAIRRPVRFLALSDLWSSSALLGAGMEAFGAIQLSQRYPVQALRAALSHLAEGGILGVFPEGRRSREWGDSPIHRGAAWLALRAGVPVVPVALWGTQHAMPYDRIRVRRAPIRVVVGEPIHPSAYADDADAVGSMTAAIRSVLDRELQALAAG